jgi:fatty-acyl-CoA synthase
MRKLIVLLVLAIGVGPGWLSARHDDDSRRLVGRAKDMRFCGGFKVYPNEVESCLAQHRAGALSAVIGVPHAPWGEAVMAVALLKEGAGVEAAELIAHVTERKGWCRHPRWWSSSMRCR